MDPKESTESPYVFCGNDPFNKIDPNGDSWWSVLIDAVVNVIGIIATVVIPELLGAEIPLAAKFLLSVASGIEGSLSSNLTAAACDKEPITAKMVIGSIAEGAISGLGEFAGPAEQAATRLAMNVGLSAGTVSFIGETVNHAVNTAVDVAGTLSYDGITDTPVSTTSIMTSIIAGFGSGLLNTIAGYALAKPSGVKTIPVMMSDNEPGAIIDGGKSINSTAVGESVFKYSNKNNNTNFFSFADQTSFKNTARSIKDSSINPFESATKQGSKTAKAGIACHGFGQHCFVVTNPKPGVTHCRPINGSMFVDYVNQKYNLGLNNHKDSLKLFVCFSGGSPKSIQTAQKFANALNCTVYATGGSSYPWKANQLYRTFQ